MMAGLVPVCQITNFLNANDNNYLDMAGIIFLTMGMTPNPTPRTTKSAAQRLVEVLYHLYPEWKRLRDIYWP